MQLDISDDDIFYTEKLLLPTGKVFNEERRTFIRSMESRDVVACPGSGKTTTLLAKLLILAKKMPFADGRGACVLTHTNVAMDVIKSKAGTASDVLFRYPNFFGTIHSFVGTYLAIPAFVELFGHRQIWIDDDVYRRRANREYSRLQVFNSNGAIYQQVKGRLKGKNRREQGEIKMNFFADLTFRFEAGYISYYRGDTGQVVLKGKNKPSDSYGPVHSAKYGLLQEGFLRYNDVFPLANLYITNVRSISDVFQERFAFVFVDEMQDSDDDQVNTLDMIFPQNSKQVVQRIGDPNQAIYHEDTEASSHWLPKNPLHISNSCRYGESISKLLHTVRLDDSINLQPSSSTTSYAPHLILFEEGEEQRVIPAFAALIIELENDQPVQGQCESDWLDWQGRYK